MNAVSSHRPFGESAQADWNQTNAYYTWESVFSSITYFGEPCSWINPNGKTNFIPCQGKPLIKNLALYASTMPGWTAIINADIQLEPGSIDLPQKLTAMQANCAYSFRIPVGGTKPVDMGLDVFIATAHIWQKVAMIIPAYFKLGCIQWDTWLVSFFVNQCKCVDFTPLKLVYHPTHQERNDQSVQVNKSDWYLNNVKMAAKKLVS